MPGQKPSEPPARRPKSKTPAERAVEFTDTQRRLKQEAADRREAANPKKPGGASKSGGGRS